MSERPSTVLVVDDIRMQREAVCAALARLGYQVETADCGREALGKSAPGCYDLLLVAVPLSDISAVEFLRHVRQHDEDQCVVLMASEGGGLSAVGAIRAGADDCITKPIHLDEQSAAMEVILARSLERRRLRRENSRLQQQLLAADRLNAAMSLAGAATHAMNQPLTVITGLLDLLAMEGQHPDSHDLETLRQAAGRLGEVVRKLGQITAHRAEPCVEGVPILDFDRSAEVVP